MKVFRLTCLMMASMMLLFSCGNRAGRSEATGWNFNDSRWGGYDVSHRTNQGTAPGLVFIEGGSFVMGHVAEDPRYSWDNNAHTVTVSSFYMDECEVSNKLYGEFVYWMKRVYGEEFNAKYRACLPDTAAWRDKLAWREDFVDNYFRAANYQDYPVVGVSWEQAQSYCTWRTDRVNEKILVDMGIIALEQENLAPDNAFHTDVYLAGQYNGEILRGVPDLDPANAGDGEGRLVRRSDGILYPNYRLPTEAEWEFASLGMIGNTYDERVTEHKTYPWSGHSLRSANKKYYGQFLANFKRTRGDAMGVAGNLNDGWDYTCPVKWYFPNDYGLYNMAGNVSEWCMDVYRKTVAPIGGSDQDPFRGNIYMVPEVDPDEGVKILEDGTVNYVPEAVQLERRNYRQADNVNYLDGDRNSSLTKDAWDSEENVKKRSSGSGEDEDEEGGEDEEVYDEDENADEDAEEVSEAEDNSDASYTSKMYNRKVSEKERSTSLINNRVRVVKGGSWKDRAYYLQAGTRRFYDQDRSTSWIGFRCAMDRLGSRVQ